MKLRFFLAAFLLAISAPAHAADIFANQPPSASTVAPAINGAAVTPNDSTPLAQTSRMLYVGGAGNLVVILAGDTAAITFNSVPAGTVLNIRAATVKATGTTATNILDLW